ncbi:MAG TPA: hypothetical protein P5511_00970 [Candidatus Goldiibacteriota bacterium]|nr:hypothetical protein [Candidatus Goldiibacteriota bacterium]
MKYYLMDGTGYLRAASDYAPNVKSHIFNRAKAKLDFIYMPQFSVTDVLRRLTKKYLADKVISEDRYKKECSDFISRIRDRNLIYIYDLHRYHNLNAKEHEIYKKYWQTCKKNGWAPDRHKFGAQQVLLVAMAYELKKRHISPGDEVVIYTNMSEVHGVVEGTGLKIEIPGEY